MSEKPYKTSRWSRHPNYECLSCPFATLDKQLIEEHVRQVHGAQPVEAAPPKETTK